MSTAPLFHEGTERQDTRVLYRRQAACARQPGLATDLQELEVDVREAAGAQLHLQRAERGEQLQGDYGPEACAHGRHTLHVLQLAQPQAPDGSRVDVLVLPPGAWARDDPQEAAGSSGNSSPALGVTRPRAGVSEHGPSTEDTPPSFPAPPVLPPVSPQESRLSPSEALHSRHGDVPAAAAQLHLLAGHGQVGEPAAGLVGPLGALGGQVLGGDLSTQGLQLRLVVDLEGGHGRAGLTTALLPSSPVIEPHPRLGTNTGYCGAGRPWPP